MEFRVEGDTVRMIVVSDVMHNAEWSRLAEMGWLGQLARLDGILGPGPRGP